MTASPTFDETEREQIDRILKPVIRRQRANDLDDNEIRSHLRRRYNAHDDLIEAALSECTVAAQAIIRLKDPTAIVSAKSEWYCGPQAGDRCWPRLSELHEKSGKWSEDDLKSLDGSSSRIVSSLPMPGAPLFKSKGLVVGYVQSGKTASYTSVISKAADAGFKVFIVIAGVTERLRSQTQRRLKKEIVDLNPDKWHTLTAPDYDFSAQMQNSAAAAILSSANSQFVLAVVKKNTARLRRLAEWLDTARNQLEDCAVMIIDDEADEASINTARQAQHRTAINSRIVGLMRSLPKVAYVAYTATPFANLLVAPENVEVDGLRDLYPSDFIIDLPRPPAYTGAEKVFGRDVLPAEGDASPGTEGLDLVRSIPDEDSNALKVPSAEHRWKFEPPCVASLEEAVRWFILTCAARRSRGHAGDHMTMLVHTSQYVAVHGNTRSMLKQLLADISQEASSRRDQFFSEMEAHWLREYDRVASERIGPPDEWNAVKNEILPALATLNVYVENGVSQEIDFDAGTVQGIVVGGNVLSRGLTIEGLAVSYFLRTASTYDTLMQMGRWFGYRKGYLDLSRIWMPDELAQSFADLALVEEEIRVDIRRYRDENLTPLDFAVRIRRHSTLLVTSALKMRHAVQVKVGFAGREVSTRIFYHEDDNWLKRGWDEGSKLLDRLDQMGVQKADVNGHQVHKGVPADAILEFLDRYPVHPQCREFNKTFIADYIRHALKDSPARLARWNVVLIQGEGRNRPTADLGAGRTVRLVSRSKAKNEGLEKSKSADIRALTSLGHAGLDLSPPSHERGGLSREGILAMRDIEAPGVGLLLLYPIDKDSKAAPGSKNRVDLKAAEHILAAALVIPGGVGKGTSLMDHDYISANLSLATTEEPEEQPFVESDDGVTVQNA